MKKILFFIVVGMAILLLLLQQWIGFDIIWKVLKSIDPILIPFIVIMPFAIIMVYSYRWMLLLRSVGIDARVNVIFRYALIGIVFNYITPMMRFGGEPIKGYMLARHYREKKRRVFASVAMYSVITFISLLSLVYFSAFSLSLFNVLDRFTLWIILTIVLMPLTVGGYVVYDTRALRYVSRKAENMVSRMRRGAGRGLTGDMLKFRDNIKLALDRKELLLGSLAIGLAERLLEIFTLYIIFFSLGVDIGFVECAVIMGIGLLAGGVPFLPGGLVLYESSTIFVATILGVHFAPATSAILLWRFVSYWLVILVGIIYSWFYGVSFSLQKKRRQFFKLGS
jgi:uncharacterized protein (TIRG00374 family)